MMTPVMLIVLAPLLAGLSGTNSTPPAEGCDGDEFYFAWAKPRDVAKALACYRGRNDWMMLAILQLNGEGTPASLAAARASLERVESKDADFDALDRIIKKREANPSAKFPRVDFCRDVASTTLSINPCQAREENAAKAKSNSQVAKLRVGLDARAGTAFDRVQAAYTKVAEADGDRVYQEYIDGSVRNQEAMNQEARVRRNFLATLKKVLAGPAAELANRRTFADADRELNAVYSDNVSSYVKDNERWAADAEARKDGAMAAKYRQRNSDYKTKSRTAQHEWVRYRDVMGDLAAARWPERRDARDVARALVTEDRIRELREK